jgi:hypothetical protein
MLKLKTKWFNRWSKKNLITDEKLLDTIKNISNNLGVVNLGISLYKVRTQKIGKGKSSSFRTFVVYREADIAIFIYGFSKNEKDNLDIDELIYFKSLAKEYLSMDSRDYQKLMELGKIISIKEGL